MPKNPDDKLIEVVVLRDFWGEPNEDGTDNRCAAGTILEVTVDDAFKLIESGSVERVAKGK